MSVDLETLYAPADYVPHTTYKKERPEHREIILLKAGGKSHREIADLTGYTYQTIVNVLTQPWAKSILASILNQVGMDPVAERFRSEVAQSIETLCEIRDNPKAPSAARAACAFHILDRFMGKPVAKTEMDVTSRRGPSTLPELERELARQRERVEKLTGRSPSNVIDIPRPELPAPSPEASSAPPA